MEGIEISEGRVGARRDIKLLTIKGYVDTMTCSILLNKITEILNSSFFHVIIDMAQVNYVSSAGWGIFVGELKGVREKGGDLKIVQMTPEVYDVFEMLEFHRILSYYESIEEAINDFDLSIGLDITKSVKKSYSPGNGQTVGTVPSMVQRSVKSSPGKLHSRYVFTNTKVDERNLPLTEKVKLIIIDDPNQGGLKIKRVLNTKRFGFTKISFFQIYRLLRKLNLENKAKRYRFFRSR
ncbi:MAG: STAS domain-containing protein [bacterium]